MSEAEKDETQADATFDEAAVDEAIAESPPTSTGTPAKKGGASASIAWLALFLSLLTVAGIGYLLLEKMRTDNSADASSEAVAAVERDLDASGQSIDKLQRDINELSAGGTRTTSAIDSLRRNIDQSADLLDSLPVRMSNLERSIAALQGVSIEARNTYLVAEAEYYMQIANAQLQLAGNPYLAALVADELAALEVMEKPDIAGVTLVLASLARVVDSLPLRSAAGAAAAEAAEEEDELSGPARVWAAVRNATSGLIKVTPPGGDQAALITPDVADLARSNLSLQLQAARLALLRGEQEIFEQSLDDADAWLGLYFDTRSEQVRSTRQTMAEIRAEYASAAPPDISQSLRLLRQFKILAENAQ